EKWFRDTGTMERLDCGPMRMMSAGSPVTRYYQPHRAFMANCAHRVGLRSNRASRLEWVTSLRVGVVPKRNFGGPYGGQSCLAPDAVDHPGYDRKDRVRAGS